jgi:hypothetical protein
MKILKNKNTEIYLQIRNEYIHLHSNKKRELLILHCYFIPKGNK